MTNVNGSPTKIATRRGLFEFGVETLEKQGWKVSRILRGGKASLRQISKGSEKHRVSIRTSQDAWIAFPRKRSGDGWVTLDDVDFVVAVSVDDKINPTLARVHMIPADDARARYERAYEARKVAGHILPDGRGLWLSLYNQEAPDPVSYVGAGMGLDFPPIATRDLVKEGFSQDGEDVDDEVADDEPETSPAAPAPEIPLTIPEAKRRLAESLGVPISAIKITIEH
ncbi:hypothetical protein ELH43_36915 [Rhizobium ruizarguesonis]|uniref:hypothetical protein n=1 Tax=Rhizobium ruizarguesonis TaxID=2081791 RepID=UPI00102F6685|nr:hypothetical protein [Rhizobium ruizarguesonis]TBB60720.1 hypothetical protein ELH43_36915 [Rhizobium ruizarguesonis]